MNKQQLANKIRTSANNMRNKIDANEYKDYYMVHGEEIQAQGNGLATLWKCIRAHDCLNRLSSSGRESERRI